MTGHWLDRVHAPDARPGEYIRQRYGVPAEIGGRILLEGKPGVITGFDYNGCCLLAKFPGQDGAVSVYPPSDAVYLADCRHCAGPIAWIDCPTGGWWAHDQHPADNHDAEPTGDAR